MLDPDPVCPERLDPDPVCPVRLDPDPDPVNIRPDPQPCSRGSLMLARSVVLSSGSITYPFVSNVEVLNTRI